MEYQVVAKVRAFGDLEALRAAAMQRGMEWTADTPPQYLWCWADQTPDWVVYRPDRNASIYACTVLKRLFDPAYLRR